jgi:diguanylate cyclase (GGDEF)-like protein/PAS domain S-box-containing protein
MNLKGPRAHPRSDVDLPLPKVLRVLCVEDVPKDAELYLHTLRKAGYQLTADVVSTREEFVRKLESGSYDVILSDYRMPGWSGTDALEDLKRSAKDIPFLLVTGTIGEEAAAECIKQGAADYILKDRPTRLPDAVRRALEEKALRDERTRMEATLQQSETKFKTLFETANDGIMILNGGIFSDCNVRAEALFQCGKDDIIGHSPVEFSPPRQPDGRLSSEKAAEKIQAALNGLPQVFEWVHLRHDGTPFDAEVSLNRSLTPEVVYLQTVIRDITERKEAEEALKLFRLLIDQSNDAIQVVDLDTMRILDVNATTCLMLGYTREEFLSLHVYDIDPTVDESVRAKLDDALRTSGFAIFETLQRRKDGSTFPVEVNMKYVKLERSYVVCAIRDITQRKQAEEALLFKTALLEAQSETTIDGILVVDESDHIVFANRQFGLHFGVPDEVLSSKDDLIVRKYISDQVGAPEAFIEKVNDLYSHRDEKSRDEFKLKNGKTFDRYSAPLVDSNGRLRGRIWYFRDITDRKTAEERVQYLAYYDALTGLPNRILLQDRLTKALAHARCHNDKVAFLFLDLDRFKIINDTLGHAVGDLLLQDAAKRLESLAREQDTVVRFGGDEFLIMLTSIKDIPGVAVAARRIVETMTAEFVIQGHSLAVTCSLGISIFPDHGGDSETLIKNADTAMYRAKEQGCNNVQFFSAAMNAKAVEQLTLRNSLRLALENEELFLVYQPQMDVDTERISGFEALIRWQHPEFGLVPPDKFIQTAENSGLILPIGEWVLRTACSQARKWQDEGLLAVPVAVNVSAVQFRQEGFTELVGRVLRETGLAPEYLELEITESLLLSTGDMVFPVLQELKDMGVKLALDDFGTGYSSLSCLKYFPVSKLKIDRSFVRDIAVSPDDAAITTAIIAMGKHLKLTVIAEGVEDEFQMSFLRAHHCDEIQGYYFSRPLTVDAMAEMLRSTALHSPLDFAGHAEAI